MENYKNLEEIVNAIARLITNPHDVAFAAADILVKTSEHGREALSQWDEIERIMHDIEDGRLVYVTDEVRKTA